MAKWFPGREACPETMAEAAYLEESYWENMKKAVASGIGLAFEGE